MRRAVVIGFMLLVSVMSGLSLLVYLQIKEANDNITTTIEVIFQKTELYSSMHNAARDRVISLHAMLETDDQFLQDEQWIKHTELAGHFTDAREKVMLLKLDDNEQFILSELTKHLQYAQPAQTRVVNHILAGDYEKAESLMQEATEAQISTLTVINDLVEYQRKQGAMSLDAAQNSYRITVEYLSLTALSILIIGGSIAFYIFRNLNRSSQAIVAINRKMEATNYELEDQRDKAQAAITAKSEFLANMSHEIRTPMNAILSVIGILRSGKLGKFDATGNQMLDMAYRNSEHLLVLINDLLEFSELETGKIKFKLDKVNIRSEVSSVIESLRTEAVEKHLHISHYINPLIVSKVMLDPARVYQLLINLVNNAIKYTEEGSIRLEVNLVTVDDKKLIHFDVIDTGIGIPKEQQDEIFDKFYQVDTSSTRAYEGVGLGLSICKPIVEAMSGNIGMESVPGEGSHFWFNLPYIEADQARATASGN